MLARLACIADPCSAVVDLRRVVDLRKVVDLRRVAEDTEAVLLVLVLLLLLFRPLFRKIKEMQPMQRDSNEVVRACEEKCSLFKAQAVSAERPWKRNTFRPLRCHFYFRREQK